MSGLELSFFDDEISSDSDVELVKNALKLLFRDFDRDIFPIANLRMLKTIFIKANPQFIGSLRQVFQQGFARLYQTNLQGQTYNDAQNEQIHLFITNCLNLLPYTGLNDIDEIAIPQWVNGSWQLINYKITPIELTSQKGLNRLFIREQDRVYAYGLTPQTPGAQSHLIFMGTTYPAGQGFWSQIMTDLQGFATAGQNLYCSGRSRVRAWLDQQSSPVHVTGVSLGGALSLILAADGHPAIHRVDAQNPPGLYESKDNPFDHWDRLKNKARVVIQKVGSDPISRFGVWKEDWEVWQINPPNNNHLLWDHPSNYLGMAGTTRERIDTVEDNLEHQRRNFWLYTWLRGLFYYAALCPIHYGLRPLAYLVYDHPMEILCAACITASFLVLATLAASALYLTLGLAAVVATGLFVGLVGLVGAFYLYNQYVKPDSQLPQP